MITRRITTTSKRKLLSIVCFLTFFLSAALDNLTTAIVMASMARKLLADKKDLLFLVGMVVIAPNAGGAWSPICDVTTTMLWIAGYVTSGNMIVKLIIPSLVCLLVPLIIVSFTIKGTANRPSSEELNTNGLALGFERHLVFFAGVFLLIMVPVFKTVTHPPPLHSPERA